MLKFFLVTSAAVLLVAEICSARGGKTGIPVDQKEVGDRGRETGEDSWTSLSWTCESGERHSTGLVEMRISEDKIRY